MNRIAHVFCFLFVVSFVNAQTINDALRYSFLELGGGTARTIGLGGSMGALGADYSTLSTNPAGLAMYRSSEFVITPVFQVNRTQSVLAGANNSSNSENANDFSLSNVGIIFASQPMASKWKTMNFGIGMNKLANFSQQFTYEGSSRGSIVDRWVELSNGFTPEELYPYEEGLAFETEAIFGPDQNLVYGSDFELNPDADINRSQTVKTDGKYNEMVLALGGNYNNRFMYGLTVGLPFIQYSEEKVYTEENNEEESIPNFKDLTFSENLRTTGIGINAKIGVIYRINQMFRLGASVHTPSSISMTDRWDSSLNYDYVFEGDRFDNSASEPEAEPYEYKLKTPMRALLSGAAIIKRSGFITAEVEYVDYSKSNFDLTVNASDPGTVAYEEDLNDEIGEVFNSAINIRLGGEYVYEKFRFRAGFGIIGTPYADGSNSNTYSLGVGYRQKKFYVDFAYKGLNTEGTYTPYRLVNPAAEQVITNDGSINRYILTLGFRF